MQIKILQCKKSINCNCNSKLMDT